MNAVLHGLNKLGKHVYEGTVPAKVKTVRRRRSKAAGIARRTGRR